MISKNADDAMQTVWICWSILFFGIPSVLAVWCLRLLPDWRVAVCDATLAYAVSCAKG